MKVEPKEITFTVTRTQTFEVTISQEEGYDMPETLEDCFEVNNDIQGSPMEFVDARKADWQTQSIEATNVEWK